MEIIHLYNFFHNIDLPDPDEYLMIGTGINISANKITQEVVDLCHERGMKIGVWIDKSVFEENREFY
jgi:hypothetical protein